MRFRRSDGLDELVDPNTGVIVEGEDESSTRPSNDGQDTEVAGGNARLRGMLRRAVMAIRVKRMFEGGRTQPQDAMPRGVSARESDDSNAEKESDTQQTHSRPTSVLSGQDSFSEKGQQTNIDNEIAQESSSCSSRGGQGEYPASSSNSVLDAGRQSVDSDGASSRASIPFPDSFLASNPQPSTYSGEYPWSLYLDSVRSNRDWTNSTSTMRAPYEDVEAQIRGSQIADSSQNRSADFSYTLPQNTMNINEIQMQSPCVDRSVWSCATPEITTHQGIDVSSSFISNEWTPGYSVQQGPMIFRSDIDSSPVNPPSTEGGLESSIWVEGCGFVPINQFQEQALYHTTPGFDSNGHWNPGGPPNGGAIMMQPLQYQVPGEHGPNDQGCKLVDETQNSQEPASSTKTLYSSHSEASADAKSTAPSSVGEQEDVRQNLQTQMSLSMTEMRSLSRSLSISNLRAPRSKSAYSMPRPSLHRQSTGTHKRRFKNMFSLRRKRTSSSSSEVFHGYPLEPKSEPNATDEPLTCPELPANLVEYRPQLERSSLATPSFGSTVSESSFSITSSLSAHSLVLNASCPELGRTLSPLPSRSMMSDSRHILRSSTPETLWLGEKQNLEAFGTVEEELVEPSTIPVVDSSPDSWLSSQNRGGALVDTLVEKLCAMNDDIIKEVVSHLLSKVDVEKLEVLMNEHGVKYKEC